jgi:hypothetical protein
VSLWPSNIRSGLALVMLVSSSVTFKNQPQKRTQGLYVLCALRVVADGA